MSTCLVLSPNEVLHVDFLLLLLTDALRNGLEQFIELETGGWIVLAEVIPQRLGRVSTKEAFTQKRSNSLPHLKEPHYILNSFLEISKNLKIIFRWIQVSHRMRKYLTLKKCCPFPGFPSVWRSSHHLPVAFQ